jgi:hypothetical protein
VSEFILLTDADDPKLEEAVVQLGDWHFERIPSADLAEAAGTRAGVRAVVVTTDDPSILRAVIERAHACGIPAIVGCADDVARRRAVELQPRSGIAVRPT